jgi:FkbM family methyltransferase
MYSQNNEQQIIANYFTNNKPVHKRFLDIGANDGITLSNTAYLAEIGWSGICVEPDAIAYDLLYTRYAQSKKVKTYNCGIASETKETVLYKSGELLGVHDTGLVSTIHQSETRRFDRVTTYQETTAHMYTWQDFANAYNIKQCFAFVSIDAEGCDLEILKQLPLDLMETQLLCIEWNGNAGLCKIYTELCAGYGLKEIARNQENLIFAK